METAGLVFFFIPFISIFIFVSYNKYRVRQLIKYLGVFLEDGSINRKQLQIMFESYTPFWSYMTWFPDKDLYPAVYQNEDFVNFYKLSKAIMLSAGSLTLVGFVGGAVTDSLSK